MLTVVVEAIHAGMTGNLNYYSKRELEKAINTWLEPYNKPVLKHHDIESEPLGRVVDARLKKSSLKKNTYCSELTLNITDEDAAKKIEDGRYKTLSIGTVITKAVCSICKNDWASGSWCEHKKGQVYDGKLCYWKVEIGEHFEVSFVNQPADPYAQVINISDNKATESYNGEDAGNISNRRQDEGIMEMKAIEEIVDAFSGAVNVEEEHTAEENEEIEKTIKEEDQREGQNDVMIKLREELDGIRAKIEALESQFAEAQAKFSAVIEQSIELAKIVNEELMHHYADLAVAAGLFANAEEAEKEAASKSAKELRREILKLSSNINGAPRTIETVGCPGGEGVVEEKIEGEGKSDGYTLKDLENVLLKLLSSK